MLVRPIWLDSVWGGGNQGKYLLLLPTVNGKTVSGIEKTNRGDCFFMVYGPALLTGRAGVPRRLRRAAGWRPRAAGVARHSGERHSYTRDPL